MERRRQSAVKLVAISGEMPEVAMTAASDILGSIAAALVLATFAMKDVRLLRTTAILGHVAFIAYAALNALLPVALLHMLLPINLYRLIELARENRNCSN